MNRMISLLGLLVGLAPCLTVQATPINNAYDAILYLQRYNHMGRGNMETGELLSEQDFVAAIESFQVMANITVTGELDEKTMEMMNLPRCGMADNMGYANSARRKRYAAMNGWSIKDLTWRINSFSPDLPNDDIDRIMENALKAWSDVSQLEFTKTTATGADIIVDFAAGSHGDAYPFDGPGGTLAHAFFPTQSTTPSIAGDAHFDDDESYTDLTSAGTNLLQVAVHEFGHSLGLGHSNVAGAVMAPFYSGYIPNFQLHADDIAGIQYLYGENSGAPEVTMRPFEPEQPSACPSRLDTIVRIAGERTFAFIGDQVYELEVGGLADGYPKPISEVFPGLPNDLDAGFFYKNNGKTYFFKGDQYYRYSGMTLDAGYPVDISRVFKGLPADIDAAFVWSGNGRIYFTKGDQYYRYNPYLGRIDSGYPRPLSVWGLPVDRIDTAQQWSNSRTYFYSGDEYYRYDDSSFSVDQGYPRPTAYWWFGCGDYLLEDDPTGGSLTVAVPSSLAVLLSAALAVLHLL